MVICRHDTAYARRGSARHGVTHGAARHGTALRTMSVGYRYARTVGQQ